MSTLKKYNTEIRNLFFISVKKDIDRWYSNGDSFNSPLYKNSSFVVRLELNQLRLFQNNTYCHQIISKYMLFGFLPVDLKIYWYVLKLKKHLKQKEEDKKVEREIDILKEGLINISENFVKEVRKEKLDRLK